MSLIRGTGYQSLLGINRSDAYGQFVEIRSQSIYTDNIYELTANNGVIIENVTLKDGLINGISISTLNSQVAQNILDIAANAADISTNASNISSNYTAILANAANITTLNTNLSTLTGRVTQNEIDISTNANSIATNASNIATNAGDIAQNTSDIATNAGNIAINAGNIADNTADIASLGASSWMVNGSGNIYRESFVGINQTTPTAWLHITPDLSSEYAIFTSLGETSLANTSGTVLSTNGGEVKFLYTGSDVKVLAVDDVVSKLQADLAGVGGKTNTLLFTQNQAPSEVTVSDIRYKQSDDILHINEDSGNDVKVHAAFSTTGSITSGVDLIATGNLSGTNMTLTGSINCAAITSTSNIIAVNLILTGDITGATAVSTGTLTTSGNATIGGNISAGSNLTLTSTGSANIVMKSDTDDTGSDIAFIDMLYGSAQANKFNLAYLNASSKCVINDVGHVPVDIQADVSVYDLTTAGDTSLFGGTTTVRGSAWSTSGDTSILYVGDTNHYLRCLYGTGLQMYSINDFLEVFSELRLQNGSNLGVIYFGNKDATDFYIRSGTQGTNGVDYTNEFTIDTSVNRIDTWGNSIYTLTGDFNAGTGSFICTGDFTNNVIDTHPTIFNVLHIYPDDTSTSQFWAVDDYNQVGTRRIHYWDGGKDMVIINPDPDGTETPVMYLASNENCALQLNCNVNGSGSSEYASLDLFENGTVKGAFSYWTDNGAININRFQTGTPLHLYSNCLFNSPVYARAYTYTWNWGAHANGTTAIFAGTAPATASAVANQFSYPNIGSNDYATIRYTGSDTRVFLVCCTIQFDAFTDAAVRSRLYFYDSSATTETLLSETATGTPFSGFNGSSAISVMIMDTNDEIRYKGFIGGGAGGPYTYTVNTMNISVIQAP